MVVVITGFKGLGAVVRWQLSTKICPPDPQDARNAGRSLPYQ
jgi:hypothetical protein